MKLLLSTFLLIGTFSSYSAETGMRSANDFQRARILAKIVLAVEEETGHKCGEFLYKSYFSVFENRVTANKLTTCGSVKIKYRLDDESEALSKIKVEF